MGKQLTAQKAEKIIRRWMASSPFTVRTIGDYMKQTSERAAIFNGEPLSTDYVEFVRQVRDLGMVDVHDSDDDDNEEE